MCYGSWDCPCDRPEYECSDCDEKESTIENSKEFLESIVNMLYSSEPLDLAKFEDHLDELCGYLDVKIGKGDLQIQRIQKEKTIRTTMLPIVQEWVNYNNQYLKQLAN